MLQSRKQGLRTFLLFFGGYLLCCAMAYADSVAPNHPDDVHVKYQKMSDSDFRFASAMQVVADKCLGCHRLGGAATNFTGFMASEYAWFSNGFVVPRESQNSLLYKYLQGSGFTPPPLGKMPLGGSISESQFLAIRTWIDTMPDPSPDPTPRPPRGDGGNGLNPSQSGIHLGDRFFVKTVLDQVFGPSVATITTNEVANRISIYGGSCDRMRQPPATGQGPDTCTKELDVQMFNAPVVPVASPSRAGRTMLVCAQLVFDPTALQYAISAATQKSDLSYLKSYPIPTVDEIKAAYALFNPAEPMLPQAAIDKILELANAARESGKEFEPWRYTLLVLCYDPQNQVS